MDSRFPEPLRALVEQLARLPGLGPKSALRIAMALLKWPEAETRRLGKGIFELRDALGLCGRCGGLAAAPVCQICADPERDRDVLCVVAEWDSLAAIEAGGFYHGQYLVLGGLLEPLQKRDSQSLDLDRLFKRLGEGEVAEVILALGATLEADNTASFLKKKLGELYPGIVVSRLAQGMPLGSEVKYMDKETLRQSLRYRQKI